MTAMDIDRTEATASKDASAPAPKQNSPPAAPPTGGSSSSAASAQKKKQLRGLRPAQVLQDQAILNKIEWSKECRPDDDLADLIEAGRAVVSEYDRSKRDWEAAGKPGCEACNRTHPPPCMSKEDTVFLSAQRILLKAYESEASAPPPAPTTGTEGSSESKGKGKANVAPEPEKDAADADAKQPSSGAKKGKKSKSNKRCSICNNYHSGECTVEPCECCNKVHRPFVPCPFTDSEREVYGAMVKNITNPLAAAEVGKMLSARFEPLPRAGPSGEGRNKRKRDDDSKEKSAESSKKS